VLNRALSNSALAGQSAIAVQNSHDGDVWIVARLNRAIINAMSGRAETGISEIRSISKSLVGIKSGELKTVIQGLVG
jgi:hypothetical protein